MPKFHFFFYDEAYMSIVKETVMNSENCIFMDGMKDIKYKKFFKYYNSWAMNKYFELPYKTIWFPKFINLNDINLNDVNYFIFYESFHFSYSRSFLKYIRKFVSNAKVFYVFTNPINEYNLEKYISVKNFYDNAITFFKQDANKYNFLHYPFIPYMLPIKNNCKIKYDLFFVGANKGRLSKLYDVYNLFVAKGLKCNFYITDVEQDDIRDLKGIVFNKRISYDEVLEHISETKAILEIIQNDYEYISLRVAEAMQYKKILITTNSSIIEQDFFNTDIIKCFKNTNDIDLNNWDLIDISKFPPSDLWSVEKFKDFLISNS